MCESLSQVKIHVAARVCESREEAIKIASQTRQSEQQGCCQHGSRWLALEFSVDAMRAINETIRIQGNDAMGAVCSCTNTTRCCSCTRWWIDALSASLIAYAATVNDSSAVALIGIAHMLSEITSKPATSSSDEVSSWIETFRTHMTSRFCEVGTVAHQESHDVV